MPVAIRSIRNLKTDSMVLQLPRDGITVTDGSFTVMIGRNGSGKTTLMEAILGVRTDYEVDRTILDDTRCELADTTKRKLGVSTQAHSFADGVSVYDVVMLHARSYRTGLNDALLETLDLKRILKGKYIKISSGQKKRLSLYFALAHEPQLCILDEPEAGLDDQGIKAFWTCIEERTKNGKTTIAASHQGETIALADDLIFLNAGTVRFSGSRTNFIEQFLGKAVLEVNVDGLSQTGQDLIADFGRARCFEGMGKNKLLIFGRYRDLSRSAHISDNGIKERSILRDIRPSDILTWVNNREE